MSSREFRQSTSPEEIEIAAPIEIACEACSTRSGEAGEIDAGGRPFAMVVRGMAGGTLFIATLGQQLRPLWGHVQSIEPPTIGVAVDVQSRSAASTTWAKYPVTATARGTRLKVPARQRRVRYREEIRPEVGPGGTQDLNRIRRDESRWWPIAGRANTEDGDTTELSGKRSVLKEQGVFFDDLEAREQS